jgi:hypothetical protein
MNLKKNETEKVLVTLDKAKILALRKQAIAKGVSLPTLCRLILSAGDKTQ